MSGTATQAREALVSANRVRMARAQIKRDIAAGKVTVPEVLGLFDAVLAILTEIREGLDPAQSPEAGNQGEAG